MRWLECFSPSRNLAREIAQRCQLSGHFTLRSGQESSTYFDKYMFECEPHLLWRVSRKLAPLIPQNTTVLAGLELGGIPLAVMLSQLTGLPTAFVRKQPKSHGTMRQTEGARVAFEKVCIVEDVVTTGGAILRSFGELEAERARVLGSVCVLWRGKGEPMFPLRYLFTMDQIIAHRRANSGVSAA